jgi:LysR family transcriptional regulator (chromosome initiation inhibitor)
MQFDPHHLSALSCVLRLGSFEAAATELCVTPSAVSQRIKALEEKVGTVLINRGAPCTGTDTGMRLAKHAEDIGLLEAQLSKELLLDGGQNPTRIRIAVNADSVDSWFTKALSKTEGLLFDLVIDDQDHSADWLKRGEVSAAICASDKPVAGCDTVELGSMRYVATASPAFVKRWMPDGPTVEALSKAPCLTFGPKDMLQRQWVAQNIGKRVNMPTHFVPSTHAFAQAARNGLGWGMNPLSMIRGPLRRGRMVPLIPDTPLDVPLTLQVSRVMAPALKSLTDAIVEVSRHALDNLPD